MKVTITELNDRRNGEVIINGYNVDLEDLAFAGSDKQVTWATEIVRTETRLLVETFVSARAKRAGHDAHILSETEADQWLAEINATLAQAAPKLQGADASRIIEARHGGLPAIMQAI